MNRSRPLPKAPVGLSKSTTLRLALERRIREGQLAPHARLPTERELSQRHGVCIITARKALADLVERGLVYRRPRVGTFVSPPARLGQVVVVVPVVWDDAFLDFFQGLVEAFHKDGEEILPVVSKDGEFERIQEDLELIYRGLTGVIFFWTHGACARTGADLRKRGIPFCYYGPTSEAPRVRGANLYTFSDRDIARLALDRALMERARPLAVILNQAHAASRRRGEYFCDLARGAGRALPDGLIFRAGTTRPWHGDLTFAGALGDWLHALAEERAVVFVTTDHQAAHILQVSRRLGYSVPKDFQIITVNNNRLCQYLETGLTVVEVPFLEDGARVGRALVAWSRKGGRPFREESRLRLVVRDSG